MDSGCRSDGMPPPHPDSDARAGTVGRYVFLDVGELEIFYLLLALATATLHGWWLREVSTSGSAG